MDKIKFNQCIFKIKNNDTDGLEQIYYEYFGKITYTAMVYTHDFNVAEDIASELILYIWQNADKIGFINQPNAWINDIAKKRAIDFVRKDSRSINVSEFDAITDSLRAKQLNEDLYVDLINLTSTLSNHEQQLIELHYIYGYKYSELANFFNLPAGTLRRQVHNIKNKIKELKKYL